MTKRDIFAELTEGFDALKEQRTGKRTLRTYEVQAKPEAEMQAAEIISLRDRLGLSRTAVSRSRARRSFCSDRSAARRRASGRLLGMAKA